MRNILQEITYDSTLEKVRLGVRNWESRNRDRALALKSGEKNPVKAPHSLHRMVRGSAGINKALGDKKTTWGGVDFSDTINNLDSEFHGHKTDRNMILYHGLKSERVDKFLDAKKAAEASGAMKFDYPVDTYHSTSNIARIASTFADYSLQHNGERMHHHVLAIHTPKGSHAINIYRDLEGNNPHQSEQEVLLHRHAKIKVSRRPISIKSEYGHFHIWPAKLTHDGIKETE